MLRNLNELKTLYESLKVKGDGKVCVYCRMPATDKEHLIPRSWIEEMKRLKGMGFDVVVPEEVIVPSCRECNLIASDKVFNSFKEKRDFIKERLLKRYKGFENKPLWTDEEIEELSGRLKEYTFFSNEITKVMKNRLKRLKTLK